jgi:hypothetical protein
VTIDWFFATGRDNPVWAVTYDLTGVSDGTVDADCRAPYGDMQWDGGAGVDVDGVGWGDRYKFRSLGAPITLDNGWDYTEPNEVPYVVEWSAAADAEMGTVQTQTIDQHEAGGYWSYDTWGTTDTDGPMPQDWNWTYQLNQYELPWGSTSKRLAWGANFGAVGSSAYLAYGDDHTASGWPYQSYAVHVVFGEHSGDPVASQVRQVEAAQTTTVTATVGSVATVGPGGAGRTDVVLLDPPGYDPRTGVWRVDADAGAATVRITTAGDPLEHPILVISGAASIGELVRDGRVLRANAGYYASLVDGDAWITLADPVAGSTTVELLP